jgi:DNA-binding CsgD family transcriptional regulator
MTLLNSITNRLSPREMTVLHSLVSGRQQKETARSLSLSPRTVETYTAHIRKKLGARTTADVVRIALRGA